MKTVFALSAFVGAALSVSVAAYPTPSEPLFISRMVKRDAATQDATSSSCGEYALQEPSTLQFQSYNGSNVGDIYLSQYLSDVSATTLTLTIADDPQGNPKFGFKTCNYQGFTQAYSRNSGGSMGAPLEFWGRVVTNTTSADGNGTQEQCLSAHAGDFITANCNDTDSKQWFRLQEGLSGSVISYFPVQNETGYDYTGQTPYYFDELFQPPGGGQYTNVPRIGYTSENTQKYIVFD